VLFDCGSAQPLRRAADWFLFGKLIPARYAAGRSLLQKSLPICGVPSPAVSVNFLSVRFSAGRLLLPDFGWIRGVIGSFLLTNPVPVGGVIGCLVLGSAFTVRCSGGRALLGDCGSMRSVIIPVLFDNPVTAGGVIARCPFGVSASVG